MKHGWLPGHRNSSDIARGATTVPRREAQNGAAAAMPGLQQDEGFVVYKAS